MTGAKFEMKQVKYRAYDKVLKKMFVVKAICFVDEMIGIKTGEGIDDEWMLVEKERVELMQYTGLKDKYGQEIFEGDVFHGYTKSVVRFDEDLGGYIPFANDGGCGCCGDDEAGQSPLGGMVVGNVFEKHGKGGDQS